MEGVSAGIKPADVSSDKRRKFHGEVSESTKRVRSKASEGNESGEIGDKAVANVDRVVGKNGYVIGVDDKASKKGLENGEKKIVGSGKESEEVEEDSEFSEKSDQADDALEPDDSDEAYEVSEEGSDVQAYSDDEEEVSAEVGIAEAAAHSSNSKVYKNVGIKNGLHEYSGEEEESGEEHEGDDEISISDEEEDEAEVEGDGDEVDSVEGFYVSEEDGDEDEEDGDEDEEDEDFEEGDEREEDEEGVEDVGDAGYESDEDEAGEEEEDGDEETADVGDDADETDEDEVEDEGEEEKGEEKE